MPGAAIAHFRQALAIRPDLAFAHNSWGIALARQARWDEAMEHYRAALRLQPGFVEARLNMAVAREAVKKLP
jgi:lipoprotein NlpI